MPLRTECVYCGNPVDPRPVKGNYRRVKGWEQTRTKGGANKITLREDTGEWACRSCIDRKLLGVDEDQLSW